MIIRPDLNDSTPLNLELRELVVGTSSYGVVVLTTHNGSTLRIRSTVDIGVADRHVVEIFSRSDQRWNLLWELDPTKVGQAPSSYSRNVAPSPYDKDIEAKLAFLQKTVDDLYLWAVEILDAEA